MTWPTHKPYTFRVKRFWFLFRDGFEILYDDTVIRTTTMAQSDVRDMVFLLNVAYTDGYMRGQMHASE